MKEWGICPGELTSIHYTYNLQGELINSGNCGTINSIESEDAELELFPNPAADYIQIKIADLNNSFTSVTITDVAGRLISVQPFSVTISVSELPAGVYYLTVYSKNKNVQRRFVKAD